jgi:transcriptional regulator with XRE-family HTH domain
MTGTSPSQPPGQTAAADVAADPAGLRRQVRQLRAAGGTYRSIAAAAGLAPATVHDLASGRRTPTPSTVRALQRVTGGALRRARVDAGGTRLRLRALHVMGHGSARIARALGTREMTIREIVRGDAPAVSGSLRDAVAGLYDAWWDKRAPERTRAERAAATAARRRAIAGNWCAGAGLDDDQLDTPGYKPRSNWKPAAGTGIAPDIHPPTRPSRQRRAGNGTPAPASRTSGEQPWR